MPSISRIDLYHVLIPLKTRIRHASHERASSDSLVAKVTLSDRSSGFGEGVPRPYVTGETIASALEILSTIDIPAQIGNPSHFDSAVEIIGRLGLPSIVDDPRGMFGNAARAAIEMALIDAFGRAFGESFGRAVRLLCPQIGLLAPQAMRVRYSGAITAESSVKEVRSAIKMKLYGFRQVKLKVGVQGQDDPRRLRSLRVLLGPRVDIRLDANEAWTPDEVVPRMKALSPYRPSAIEQPVAHEDVDSLAEIRPHLRGIPVMLDESLCGYPDGLRAVERQTADLFNVRISKCGGIGPTLKLITLAHTSGLGYQLGCHPGESGLLSAAGRHLAANVVGFRYVEGSYDRHILARNLTRQDPTFHYGGLARPLPGPGLGVDVDPDALSSMAVEHRELRA